MTLDTYTIWYNSTLKECREDGTCATYDVDARWCKYGGVDARSCSYDTCPRRCKPKASETYLKTDGSCTVRKEAGRNVELIFFDIPMTLTISEDRVRFLAKCLNEICDTLKK
jgi:hypothetical protein